MIFISSPGTFGGKDLSVHVRERTDCRLEKQGPVKVKIDDMDNKMAYGSEQGDMASGLCLLP
jgi:hypothetical protein